MTFDPQKAKLAYDKKELVDFIRGNKSLSKILRNDIPKCGASNSPSGDRVGLVADALSDALSKSKIPVSPRTPPRPWWPGYTITIAVSIVVVVSFISYLLKLKTERAAGLVQDTSVTVSREAELDTSGGDVMARSCASSMQTLHLGLRQQTLWSVVIPQDGVYELDVLYSNDGPTDAIKIIVDNQDVASFETKQTGTYGDGWNDFLTATCPVGTLSKGKHDIVLRVEQGDETGVEIDMMKLRVVGNNTMQ